MRMVLAVFDLPIDATEGLCKPQFKPSGRALAQRLVSLGHASIARSNALGA